MIALTAIINKIAATTKARIINDFFQIFLFDSPTLKIKLKLHNISCKFRGFTNIDLANKKSALPLKRTHQKVQSLIVATQCSFRLRV